MLKFAETGTLTKMYHSAVTCLIVDKKRALGEVNKQQLDQDIMNTLDTS